MLKPCAVVELIWQDDSGSTSATTFYAPSSATVIEIDASATALASILVPITGCVLVKQRISYKWVPETPSIASGGAPIRYTGVFYFNTSPSTPDGLIMVHSIKDEVISDVEPFAGVSIDRDNSTVIGFVDAILAGAVTNPFGDAFTALVAAYLQSRV